MYFFSPATPKPKPRKLQPKAKAKPRPSGKASKWFDPYITGPSGQLKAAILDCYTCAQAGVYFIRHKATGSVVYVGSSTTQLKKTIYRHFQVWTDRQRKGGEQYERKTYPKHGYQVRFIKCTASQALKVEKYLIRKLQPKDNPLKYKQLTLKAEETGKELYEEFQKAPKLNPSDYLAAPF